MSKIIKIEGTEVYIGTDEGGIVKTPIATINYANPQVGDVVDVYQDGDVKIVVLASKKVFNANSIYIENGNEKRIEKNLYVWVATFLVGYLGVDRFLRGQIALGVIKLVTGGGLGIWALIDFIIALTKVYGGAYGNDTHVVFINGEYSK